MWVPPMPSLDSMRSGAGMVRGCAAEINNPRLLKATIITAASVWGVLLILSFVSCWAVRPKAPAEEAKGAATTSAPAASTGPASDLILAAQREVDKAERATDPGARSSAASAGLALLRASELLTGPRFDTAALSARLRALT